MMIWLKRVRVKSRSVIAALTALRMASCFVEANKTGSKVGITFMHRISEVFLEDRRDAFPKSDRVKDVKFVVLDGTESDQCPIEIG